MERVTKMSHGIDCCPNDFLSLSRTASHTVKNIYIYIYVICECVCAPDWLEIVYELRLLPNNTAGETFLHKTVSGLKF
jgi:hypothetical protein